jgi:hypothetical protein
MFIILNLLFYVNSFRLRAFDLSSSDSIAFLRHKNPTKLQNKHEDLENDFPL